MKFMVDFYVYFSSILVKFSGFFQLLECSEKNGDGKIKKM